MIAISLKKRFKSSSAVTVLSTDSDIDKSTVCLPPHNHYLLMEQVKNKPVLVGGVKELENLEDADLKSSLATVVSKQNADVEIVKIISAKTQVVAGIKYIVEFLGKVRPSDQLNTYTVSYVMQPWISKEPQYVEFNTKS